MPVRRERLDGEGTGDAHGPLVLVGLIEEELLVGVASDGGVDLLARQALADVGVLGDRLEGDVRDAAVDEPLRTSRCVSVADWGRSVSLASCNCPSGESARR